MKTIQCYPIWRYSLSDCDYVFVIPLVTNRNISRSVIMANKYTVCIGCPKKGISQVHSFLWCHCSHNSWSIITSEHIPERILIWVFKIDFTSLISHVVAEILQCICGSENDQITRNQPTSISAYTTISSN